VPDLARANFLLAGSFGLYHGSARTGMDQCLSSTSDAACPCLGPGAGGSGDPQHPHTVPNSDGGKAGRGEQAVVRWRMAEPEASWQPWAHAAAGACERMPGILFPSVWQSCCVFLAQHRSQRPLDLSCGEVLLLSSLNL